MGRLYFLSIRDETKEEHEELKREIIKARERYKKCLKSKNGAKN